jgi:hypothetical protein
MFFCGDTPFYSDYEYLRNNDTVRYDGFVTYFEDQIKSDITENQVIIDYTLFEFNSVLWTEIPLRRSVPSFVNCGTSDLWDELALENDSTSECFFISTYSSALRLGYFWIHKNIIPTNHNIRLKIDCGDCSPGPLYRFLQSIPRRLEIEDDYARLASGSLRKDVLKKII